MKREDQIDNAIINAVISVFPWVFVVREHEIIPIVMIIQMFFILAYNLWNSFFPDVEEEEEWKIEYGRND